MDLTRYDDARDLLVAAQPFLEADEERTGLLFGLALRLTGDLHLYGAGDPYFAVVHDEGTPVLAALMTPPHNLVVHGAPAAVPSVIADVIALGVDVPGVLGPVELAAEVAHGWKEATGQGSELVHHERAFVLREVTPPEGVPGQLRQAAPADLELISAWQAAFAAEALPEDAPGDTSAMAARAIADGVCWLWDDGDPVSMVQQTRRTTHGATVSFVYTPPDRRGHGYASAAVAALSQQLLDGGFDFCTLFTDLANPTSNHIYQEVGYRPVGDFDQLRFIG
jgi:predicted GNAT family acetyltransferase